MDDIHRYIIFATFKLNII